MVVLDRIFGLSQLQQRPNNSFIIPNKGTLLEQTLDRITLIRNASSKYQISDPILIMHKSHTLPSNIIIPESNIVFEAYANDTAVAVAKACLEVEARYTDDVIIIVFPSDHYIYNVDNFIRDILAGIEHVTNNNIVLYGLTPNNPDPKYGYITTSETGVIFNEKPSIKLAKELLEKGALWNSGMFVGMNNLVLKCLHESKYNIMDFVINPKEGKAPSFDIAVLQEYTDIYAHPCSGWRWSDVGTWSSFLEIPEIKSEMDNSAIVSKCENVSVLNRNGSRIVVLGCRKFIYNNVRIRYIDHGT